MSKIINSTVYIKLTIDVLSSNKNVIYDSSMMTGSKVSLTIDHSFILTTDHYDMGIKMKDIQRQVKLKRNQLLISYLFRNMNFQKCEFLPL